MKKKKAINVLVAAVMTASVVSPMFASGAMKNGADVATSTTYERDWWDLNYRDKITTTFRSSSTSFDRDGKYTEVRSYTKKDKKESGYKFEFSITETASVSLGAKVPVKAIELEAGRAVSYSKTHLDELSWPSLEVGDTISILRRTKKTESIFDSTVQLQGYAFIDKEWINMGSASRTTSYLVETCEEYISK